MDVSFEVCGSLYGVVACRQRPSTDIFATAACSQGKGAASYYVVLSPTCRRRAQGVGVRVHLRVSLWHSIIQPRRNPRLGQRNPSRQHTKVTGLALSPIRTPLHLFR